MPDDVQVDMPFASGDDASPDAMRTAADERSKEMAGTAESMERLRLMQGELERKHAKLAEIGKKQDSYQAAKRDVLLRLERAQIVMEKQVTETAKAQETLKETRAQFQSRIDALNAIDESGWVGDDFEESLNRAFGLVEEAETVFARGTGRVEAFAASDGAAPVAAPQPLPPQNPHAAAGSGFPWRFSFWLKAGFAFTLPLLLAILLLSYLLLYLNGY